MTHRDPTIDEIREIRLRIEEELGNDLRRLVEYYRAEDTKYADRLWRGRTFEQDKAPEDPPEQPSE
jgi:uncharacterized protein (DUF2461 family)